MNTVTVSTHELTLRAFGALTVAAHEAAVAHKTLLQAIADETIAELAARPDILDAYKGGLDDFVFVEEAVDMRLLAAGHDANPEGFNMIGAAGLVFLWLQTTHGITPPAWFLNASKAWR